MPRALLLTPGEPDREIELPEHGTERFARLQVLVGGLVQLVDFGDKWACVNEEGKLGPHLVNVNATEIALTHQYIHDSDYIAGACVILDKHLIT